MGVGRETGLFEQLFDPSAQHRDLRDGLVVGARGEQSDEPVLADHLAVGVESLDPT